MQATSTETHTLIAAKMLHSHLIRGGQIKKNCSEILQFRWCYLSGQLFIVAKPVLSFINEEKYKKMKEEKNRKFTIDC